MSARKAIRKSVRFAVFNRDGFKCRYCGKTSEEVTLVIDHMIPHSKGGTDDEANLVTACFDCNSGKSDKLIGSYPDNDAARLEQLQRAREQMQEAKAAAQIVEAEADFRQTVVDAWCGVTGREDVDRQTITTIVGYVRQYGLDVVLHWMRKAQVKRPHDDRDMGKYISGIRRCHEEEKENR